MKKGLLVLVCLVFLLIANVSAGLYFSQPDSVYNLGDVIKTDVNIAPLSEGFLKVNLVCDDNSLNVFKGIPGEVTHIEFPLTSAYLDDVTGTCYFLGNYSGEEQKSREFKISDELDVKLIVDALYVKPGENITIEGDAKRLNGVGINGEVEIRIPFLKLEEIIVEDNESISNESETNISEEMNNTLDVDDTINNGVFYGNVIDGKFSVKILLEKDIPAGEYRLDVLAYEENKNEITSKGKAFAILNVNQVPTGIDIALSNPNVDPGVTLDFKPTLFDQSGIAIKEDISLVILNSLKERIFESLVISGETVSYIILSNLTAGYYSIEVSSGDIKDSKSVYVNEKAIVSLELSNETLIAKNIGNIPYNKDIQINLNGKPFVKRLNLNLEEEQSFKLTGNGNYDVIISDGETEISQTGITLTGRAVGVDAVRQGSVVLSTPIVWIFLIIVIGAGALFLFRNILKKKSFAYPFSSKLGMGKKTKIIKVDNNKNELDEINEREMKDRKQVVVPSSLVPPTEAEQSLVINGQKNRVAVLVLKIKNKISKESKKSLELAIEPIYEKRGAVYEQGDYIYIIFSPLMTKTFKNEVEAVRAGSKIIEVLKDHNHRFKEKIEFGISVNSGDMINKIENKMLKFTALGNLMSAGKRLAEASNEQIFVTKDAFERGMTEIKGEKRNINGTDVYEVRKVLDTEQNKKFLEGFMKRNSK